MRITEAKLLIDYYRGLKKLERHPCTVCNSGIPFKEFPHFHGSDFGKCPRAVQFEKYSWERERFDDHTSALLRDGHVHEDAVVSVLREAGYTVTDRDEDDEFVSVIDLDSGAIATHNTGIRTLGSVSEKINLCMDELSESGAKGFRTITVIGHTDGVINGTHLLECKAVKDWAFEKKFKQRNLPNKYLGQMHCYMTCKNLKGGVLFAKARHTGEPLPFIVKRDDGFTLKRANILHDIIAMQEADGWIKCEPPDPAEKRWCRACKILS